MNAHTPGHWFVDPSDKTSVVRQFTSPRVVNEVVCKTKRAWMTSDEQVANARLIAAAPELLAALKGMAMAHRSRFGLDGAWDAELVAAEAAIAKAEGRE